MVRSIPVDNIYFPAVRPRQDLGAGSDCQLPIGIDGYIVRRVGCHEMLELTDESEEMSMLIQPMYDAASDVVLSQSIEEARILLLFS